MRSESFTYSLIHKGAEDACIQAAAAATKFYKHKSDFALSIIYA